MTERRIPSRTLLGIALTAAAVACSTTTRQPAGTTYPAGDLATAARADSLRNSFTPADVDFMTGMIHHHAQALVMARMAPTHGASGALQVMAGRIINGQNDEIGLMQQWLRERNQPIPDHESPGAHVGHGAMHMPGMLTVDQLAELDAARGADFERLFLTYMIQHHQGALTMVEELFSTYGAGQGDAIFKLASDIGADQSSEIDRMRTMLRSSLFGNR